MCCGMTAIRLAIKGQFETAVAAILLAAFLDGMDGRIARFLGSTSRLGAELDSLADLVNFGAAPGLVMYMYSLQTWGRMGWGIVLFYTACVALRLARFNIQSKDDEKPQWTKNYFIGVPSTMGGYLAVLPIMMGAGFELSFASAPYFSGLFVIFSGGMMVSRLHIFTMKNVNIPQKMVLPIMLCVVLSVGFLYSYPWIGFSLLGLFYLALIPISEKDYRKKLAEEKQS